MDAAIRLDLLVPRMGFISLAKMPLPGGTSLAYILEPLCPAPCDQVREGLQSWDRFPLRLDVDQGLEIPTPGGPLGFFNARGLLQVTLPGAIASLLDAWKPYEVQRRTVGHSVQGTYRVAPGLRGAVDILGQTLEIRAPAPALTGGR